MCVIGFLLCIVIYLVFIVICRCCVIFLFRVLGIFVVKRNLSNRKNNITFAVKSNCKYGDMIERYKFCELRNGAAAGVADLSGFEKKVLEMYSFAIFLCADGEAEFEINFSRKTIHQGEWVVMPKNVNVMFVRKSVDFSIMYTVLSEEMSNDIYYNFLHFDFWMYINRNFVFSYHREFSASLKRMFQQNKWIVDNITMDNKVIKNRIYNLLVILYFVLKRDDTLLDYDSQNERGSKDDIVFRFLILVRQHCVSNRDVAFYAKKLSLNSDYLSELIKERCGMTPKKIIDEEVVMRIKIGLLYSKDTIKSIADKTGFKDSAYMCNFFQRRTGVSPMQFRLNDR